MKHKDKDIYKMSPGALGSYYGYLSRPRCFIELETTQSIKKNNQQSSYWLTLKKTEKDISSFTLSPQSMFNVWNIAIGNML